jgi:protein-tyrosine phosphatase
LQKILFICTGNIFRSLSAECALRLAAGNNEGVVVSSAGTAAEAKPIPVLVQNELGRRGADFSAHLPRKLTAELLHEATLPIAIGTDHQEFVKENFGLSIPLLNQVAKGDSSSIPDLWEVYPDWREQPPEVIEAYTRSTINHIFNCMPPLVARIGLKPTTVSK